SDDFPKATFRGKINGFSANNLNTAATMDGSLTFHGVTHEFKDIAVNISEKGGNIMLSGSFMTKASDYKIKIPKVVRNKVTDEVDVKFEFELKKQ
ncbi:MAG: YceI family protein, partial [Bacteroidia bacterium]|nr:YceI family protein [Bacteroidia bacterium]